MILARLVGAQPNSRPRTLRSPSAETSSRSEGHRPASAAYTTGEPGADAVRLATEHDVDLILARCSIGPPPERPSRPGSRCCPRARTLRRGCALRGRRHGHRTGRDAVRRHRARLGRNRDSRLARPIPRNNTAAPRNRGEPCARATRRQPTAVARLDARAAGSRNRHRARPRPPGEAGVLDASRDARLLVVGLSDRWRAEGIGHTRLAVALGAEVPTLFVRRGLRPSGVAPNETLTRFTWTLGSARIIQPDV